MGELFDTKEFRAIYGWFLTVDMTSIRTKAYQTGAITYGQKQTLDALASQGTEIHNDKLLDMVRAADSREAFKHLAEAVKSLGEAYEPKYKQLMAILDLGKSSALSALGGMPQFHHVRQLVRRNPTMLPSFLAQIGQQNPPLLALIRQNQQAFIDMMSEPDEGDQEPAASHPAADDNGMMDVMHRWMRSN